MKNQEQAVENQAANVENGVSIEVSAKFGDWILSNPEFCGTSKESTPVWNDEGVVVDTAVISEGSFGDDSLILLQAQQSPESAIIQTSKGGALDLALEYIWWLEQNQL